MKTFFRTAARVALGLSVLVVLAGCNTSEYADDVYGASFESRGQWTVRYSGDMSLEFQDNIVHVYSRGANIKISGAGNFVVHGCGSLKVTLGAHVEAHDCVTVKALPSTSVVVYNCQRVYAPAGVPVEVHGPTSLINLDASVTTGAVAGDLPVVGK